METDNEKRTVEESRKREHSSKEEHISQEVITLDASEDSEQMEVTVPIRGFGGPIFTQSLFHLS